jgi:multicomponent Na+:H+ antiporter subunit D
MAVEGASYPDIAEAMVTAPVALADWLVVAPVALPILFAAVLLMLRQRTAWQPGLAIAGLAVILVADIALLYRVIDQGPVVMTMGRWLPPFGISFVADSLGVVLTATAALVTFVCAIYGVRDIDNSGRRYGFYTFMMAMLAGVSGSFLTGDVFNLYVWFEIFLIASFGLIILGSSARQLDGAVKYAVLNLVATTLFLLATGLLYGTFGTLNMADIARKAPELRDTAPLMTLAVLYLTAFGMKAAAFPLSFWLPASYHTPRIVVAALFGGLLTKVGIYALLRSLVMLFPEERGVLGDLIGWVAIATMLLGVAGALAQSDIRRVLGFIVVSGIGVMLAGIALGGQVGVTGTVVYAVHSMIVMAALYLLAGMMNQVGGSYSLHKLSGLYRSHPLMAAIALILVLAAAGLPPGSGLWPKVYLVKASLDAGAWMLAFAILLSGLLTTLALGRVFALSFWRDRDVEGAPVGVGSVRLGYGALLVLLVPTLLIGLYPEPVIQIADEAARGLLDAGSYVGVVFPAEGGAR